MKRLLATYRLCNLGVKFPEGGDFALELFLFLLLPLLGFSQNPFQNPTILNHLDGMPSDRILSIAKDEEGFMWFGTDGGLVRYDGTLMEVFHANEENSTALKNGYIIAVWPDKKNGKIWLGTLAGLSAYDPSKKVFKNYRHDPNNPNSVPDFPANRIMADRAGDVWMGFKKGGLLRYRPATDDFEPFICDKKTTESNAPKCTWSVTDIKEDNENDSLLWLGTSNGLVRFNKHTGGHRLFVFEMEEERRQTEFNNIRCIFLHSDNKIYYGTWWEGVMVFDKKTRLIRQLDPCYKESGSAFERGVSLGFHQKSLHEFWINSTSGTQLYDTRNGCISQTYPNDKERSFAVDYVDGQGRTWCASRKHGVLMFNPLTQQSRSEFYEPIESGFSAFTSKILEDTLRKKLLVASELSQGLYIYDLVTKEWAVIPPPENYEMERAGGFRAKDMIFLDDGAVLIVEYNNLYWYQPGFERLQLYSMQPTKGNGRLHRIMKDRAGGLWITSRGNLYFMDLKNQQVRSFEKELQEVWQGQIICDYLVEDKNGNIWLREVNGLVIYEREKNRFIYHQHDPTGRPAFRGMGAIEAEKNGQIWISTNRQYLAYAHADSIEQGVLRLYGKEAGLAGETIYSIKLLDDQLLTIALEGIQFFDPVTKKSGHFYETEYGFNWELYDVLKLSDGRIVACGAKRIVFVEPNTLATNKELPIPYVSSFKVFDKTWPLKNRPSEPDTVWLSYKQNFFSFEFSAIGYNLSDKNRFEYKLEGIDENWMDGTKRKFAAYTNVPGGDYRFLAMAINNEGQASEKPSVTYLHITTVWWKTVWFWALAFGFFAGIGYLVYKWRIGQVRKEERLKAEYERKLTDVEMSALRAQMNPHFIFNSLNSIEYYIITNEQEKAVDYLSRFSRLIRLILQNSKSTIVPLKDDLEALKLYIEIEAMRFDNKFDYEVKMEKGLDPETVKIPPLLLQPFVENSIWHGLMQKKDEKGKIDLTLRRSNGHLVCLIEDNGIGREAAQQLKSKSASRRKSYGMKITSDRLSMLNKLAGADASINIFDLKNEDGSAAGTRVELVIPI